MASKVYETECVQIDAEYPEETRGMTAEQIVAYGREHFKTEGDFPFKPANTFTAYMEAVGSAIFDPDNWKAPCRAYSPWCGLNWAAAAVIWYHGAQPIEGWLTVSSTGYACY